MSLQQELQLLQRVTPGIRHIFLPLEEVLREDFLPSLLGGPKEEVDEALHKSTTWGIQRAVLWILDPTQTASDNFETS